MIVRHRVCKLGYGVMMMLLVELLVLCSCSRANLAEGTQPEALVQADAAYATGRYEQAAEMYSHLAQQAEVEESLQSLCYYRAGAAYNEVEQRGRAIVNYRRALLLAPDYSEARHNLRLVEEARMNMPAMEYPIVRRWADACAYAISMNGWLTASIVLFAGGIVTCLAFFLGHSRRVRRGSFYAMLALIVLWGCTLLMILHRRHYDQQADVAVLCGVKAPLYALEDDPSVATPMMELYDGAEMCIDVEDRGQAYLAVTLPDGISGQIARTAIEKVVSTQT